MTQTGIPAEDAAARGPERAAVAMQDICMQFGPVRALDHVSFYLRPGEVRALVGENGAGKSTLMNILFGMYRPTAGRITVLGEDVTDHWSPRMAMARGIGMVHQHFSLVANHTVLENVVMPTLKWGTAFPRWRDARDRIARLCATYGFQINPGDRVQALSVGEKQQVEILKALYQGVRVLVLDEPTGVLTPQQTGALLEFLLQLRQGGHSVVLVTHKLTEAMSVADRITVLRGGRHVGTVDRADTTVQAVARMMVDREMVSWTGSTADTVQDRAVLEAAGLAVEDEARKHAVDDVSLRVSRGEIVGVAGVAGNGQVELAEALVGLRRLKAGSIALDGVRVDGWSIGRRRRAGIGFIPEDRHALGLVLDMSVAENLCLDAVGGSPYSRRGVLQPRAMDEHAAERVRSFEIKTPTVGAPAGNLSGGNQQRVVLARVLSSSPKVIVACQPTRGLDFTAMEYVRRKLVEASRQGVGVLLVSSDLDELLELSHRIVVMYRGRIAGDFRREDVDLERLGLLMAGHFN